MRDGIAGGPDELSACCKRYAGYFFLKLRIEHPNGWERMCTKFEEGRINARDAIKKVLS